MKRILITIFLFSIVACSNSNKQAGQKGWSEYKKPKVFSIKHPKGWDVEFNKKNGRIKLSRGNYEDVYIWPVYSQRRLDVNEGARLLEKLVWKIKPDFSWNDPITSGRNTVTMRGSENREIGSASLNWVSNQNSSAVICYVIAAREDYFKKDKNDLIGILSSFRPIIVHTNKPSRPQPPALQFVRWQDPNERAFTVEVPEGWHVRGGLVRHSPTDCRRGVNLVSPDGNIDVFLMDPRIPLFALPTQTLAITGITVGSYYRLQDGTEAFVRRYVPGANFAYEYATRRFSNELTNFSIVENRNRPDIASIDNRENEELNLAGQGMIRTSVTAGEVTFNGSRNGQPYSGYVEASTLLNATAYGGAGDWVVKQLYGFSAPKSRVRGAAMVMKKLVSSFMWNPQWFMMQYKIRANVSHIVSQTGEEIGNIINSSFELNQKIQDKTMQKFSDAILGTIPLRDNDGQVFKVYNTSNYYWIDGLNNIVGTKQFINPDPVRFNRMFEVK